MPRQDAALNWLVPHQNVIDPSAGSYTVSEGIVFSVELGKATGESVCIFSSPPFVSTFSICPSTQPSLSIQPTSQFAGSPVGLYVGTEAEGLYDGVEVCGRLVGLLDVGRGVGFKVAHGGGVPGLGFGVGCAGLLLMSNSTLLFVPSSSISNHSIPSLVSTGDVVGGSFVALTGDLVSGSSVGAPVGFSFRIKSTILQLHVKGER